MRNHSLRCRIWQKRDWALYGITHGILCWYIFSTMPARESSNFWHGLFECLTNSLLLPVHHWVFLLWMLYRASAVWILPETASRFQSRTAWLKALLFQAWRSTVALTIVNCLAPLLWSLLRYGAASGIAWVTWGDLHPITMSVPAIFLITVIARLLVSWTVSVFFVFLLLRIRSRAMASGISLLLLLLADLVLMETPPYLSFKPLVFTSSFSFLYFSRGTVLENMLLSYGLSLTASMLLYLGCRQRVKRKERIFS